PVKRYSSGMYVRLAFAVAAHLEPEILLVDEVLAVGDAQFQKRCLGKMHDVAHNGRTILFVSHNMAAIEQLCSGAILLKRGHLSRSNNDVRGIIRQYLMMDESGSDSSEWANVENYQNPYFTPLRFRVGDYDGVQHSSTFSNEADIWLYIEGHIAEYDPALNIGYAIYSEDGQPLYWSFHMDGQEENCAQLNRGACLLRARIPRRLLNQGNYRVELLAAIHYC